MLIFSPFLITGVFTQILKSAVSEHKLYDFIPLARTGQLGVASMTTDIFRFLTQGNCLSRNKTKVHSRTSPSYGLVVYVSTSLTIMNRI